MAGTVQAAIVSQVHARSRTGSTREDFDLDEHLDTIGEDLFTRLYWLSLPQFRDLCSELRPELARKQNRKNCYCSTKSVETMLCITMRILAVASYLDAGWADGLSISSTYAFFHKTLDALNNVLGCIQFPIYETEFLNAPQQFTELRRSPLEGIIAALDVIAIKILQPTLHDTPDPRKYFIRKGFYALSVQAAVGANYKFLFISARHAGSTHDSTAFQATVLYELARSARLPRWARIAADDAYANSNYVLTPYGGHGLSLKQDSFNFYLSSCRITVEQAFGMLVSRFRNFWSLIRFSVARSTLIVVVCCKIHKYLIDIRDENYFQALDTAQENQVQGTSFVHTKNSLHLEQALKRSRVRTRENTQEREKAADRLFRLGLVRPRATR